MKYCVFITKVTNFTRNKILFLHLLPHIYTNITTFYLNMLKNTHFSRILFVISTYFHFTMDLYFPRSCFQCRKCIFRQKIGNFHVKWCRLGTPSFLDVKLNHFYVSDVNPSKKSVKSAIVRISLQNTITFYHYFYFATHK